MDITLIAISLGSAAAAAAIAYVMANWESWRHRQG